MTRQEENWELMTILQIPWSETVKITDEEDRSFLINKAAEVKAAIMKQQQQERSGLVTSI